MAPPNRNKTRRNEQDRKRKYITEHPDVNYIGEEVDRSEIPATAYYEHTDRNVIGVVSDVFQKAVDEGKKKKNEICCNCKKSCATNRDCACRKLSIQLASLNSNRERIRGKIPIQVTKEMNKAHEQLYFSCGPKCACDKRICSMNVAETDKRVFDCNLVENKGRIIQAKQAFKTGHPVAAFNGSFEREEEIVKCMDSQQYSFRLMDKLQHPKLWERLTCVSPEYKDTLLKAYMEKTFINPLHIGNCTRFLSHCCKPNLIPLCVFEGGVAPQNIRLVFYALKDIAIGEELTFDYGETYLNEHLRVCMCDYCIDKRQRAAEAKRRAETLKQLDEQKKELQNQQRAERCRTRAKSAASPSGVDENVEIDNGDALVPVSNEENRQIVPRAAPKIKIEVIDEDEPTAPQPSTSTSGRTNLIKAEVVVEEEQVIHVPNPSRHPIPQIKIEPISRESSPHPVADDGEDICARGVGHQVSPINNHRLNGEDTEDEDEDVPVNQEVAKPRRERPPKRKANPVAQVSPIRRVRIVEPVPVDLPDVSNQRRHGMALRDRSKIVAPAYLRSESPTRSSRSRSTARSTPRPTNRARSCGRSQTVVARSPCTTLRSSIQFMRTPVVVVEVENSVRRSNRIRSRPPGN
ncbi:unnamed protein product [Caenorhabditis sp. 36 PRJEB53466]|nr:unnamed protein product [Caenorhabditis sp. 36 PRJEB53466]